MKIRRITAIACTLAALCALRGAPPAKGQAPESVRRIAAEWRTVGGDSAALASLLDRTAAAGGETLLRTLLAVSSDPTRPTPVRVHAVAGLGVYMHPWSAGAWLWRTMGRARWYLPVCDTSTRWAPGDTLRVCMVPGETDHDGAPRSPPSLAALTVEPVLRDTVRDALRRLVATDTSRLVVGAARYAYGIVSSLEGWNVDVARNCARLAASEAARAANTFWPQGGMCPVSLPPRLAAAWDAAATADSAALAAYLEGSVAVRDRRIAEALRRAAADEARPARVRLTALRALAVLAHPDVDGVPSLPPAPLAGCPAGRGAYPTQEEGPEPLARGARGEIAAFLESLSARAGDGEVRAAAGVLARCVRARAAEHPIPLP